MAEQVHEIKTRQQVEEFYNSFKEHQKKLGVNIRHRTIFKNLKKAGLKSNSKVLEVGCGIGTVSSLILKYINAGKFVGVDISSESIEMARRLNGAYANATFVVNDMTTFSSRENFDFVVLPDVLEHIPVEQHADLFKVLASVTAFDATVLINIPEPHCLDWIRKTRPELLQIIDQSLSMQDLLNSVYPAGFKVYSISPYSLQYNEPDYVSIVLKKNMSQAAYTRKSKLALGARNIKSKLLQ